MAKVDSSAKLGRRGRMGGVLGKTALTRQRSGGVNEVQTVTVSGATGGTIRITIGGLQTGTIAFNAAAAAVQTALDAVHGAGTFVCTGGPLNTAAVTITAAGKFANTDIAQMTIDSSALVGGSATPATTTQGVTRYAMDEDQVSAFAAGSNFNENIPFYQHPSRRGG